MTYKKVTTSTNDVFSGEQVTIYGISLYSGSDAATAILENAATSGTNDFAKISCAAGATLNSLAWQNQGLVVRYVSVTLTGTSPALYIYYA